MDQENNGERNYIAFISYRHQPLDTEIAKRLHRRIEHYRIPKNLRKDGKSKLGLVFRDQDELTISRSLGAKIEEALDHSEYLIVVCTPNTPASVWVRREITYFLEHHDRDHLITVLADGEPGTSFPPELIEDNDEPLAANIVAGNDRERRKLFKTESLRILAAMIGCPYDALYNREQRYRLRRVAVVACVILLIAAAFIGMLINRNMKVSAQLEASQINESTTLAALSQMAYDQGNYNGALEYAVSALPSQGNERPYVPAAEYALSSELGLYQVGVLRFVESLEQETNIIKLLLSPDSTLLATMDEYGSIRVYDTATGRLRWQTDVEMLGLIVFNDNKQLLATSASNWLAFDAADGGLLWQRNDINLFTLMDISPDNNLALCINTGIDAEQAADTLRLLDLNDGRDRATLQLDNSGNSSNLYVALALNQDASMAALLVNDLTNSSADLLFVNLESGDVYTHPMQLPYVTGSISYTLRFTNTNDLLVACDNMAGASSIRLFSYKDNWRMKYETVVEAEKTMQIVNGETTYYSQIDLFTCVLDRVVFCSKHELSMINLNTGELLWHHTLPGMLVGSCIYSNACMGLVFSDGTISFCTDEGALSYTFGMSTFTAGFDVVRAAVQGPSFPESSFILVPANNRNRAVLVRYANNESMIPVTYIASDIARLSLVSSPSGQMVAAVGIDPTGRPARVMLLDAAEGITWQDFELPENCGFEDLGQVTLTNDAVLVSPTHKLDLRTQQLTDIDNSALDTQADTSIGLADLPASIDEADLPFTTCKILPACDGSVLLVFTETGVLSIYDANNGTLLQRFEQSNNRVHFAAQRTHYEARLNKDASRLFVFTDNSADDLALCMVFDTKSWECVGSFENVCAYLPERDCVLVCPYLDGAYMCPFWNLDDMLAAAEKIIAR